MLHLGVRIANWDAFFTYHFLRQPVCRLEDVIPSLLEDFHLSLPERLSEELFPHLNLYKAYKIFTISIQHVDEDRRVPSEV